MHPGFRYHLASLMAVFLSLVLGILIGGAIYQDSGLVEEQGLLISQMEKRFLELQVNLAAMENQLGFNHQIWRRLRDFVIADKLADETVFVMDLAANGWDWESLSGALEKAGAKPKRLSPQDLAAGFEAAQALLLVRLGSEKPADGVFQKLALLAEEGAHLTFLWGLEDKPPAFSLPLSLQIDCADIALGEIALVLGLAARAAGRFGLAAEAEGVLP
ncbi:MAG TPA: copper transporter [Firmicutes bacterium]|nr:copper transporter [Bacillota bacterium]